MVQTVGLPRTAGADESPEPIALYPARMALERQADGAAGSDTQLSLARELHDGVLQDLVYLDLELTSLLAGGGDPVVRRRVQTLKQVVRESIGELRNALSVLRARTPAPARCRTHASLQTLLEQRVAALRGRATGRIVLDIHGCKEPVRLPPEAAHHVDLIVQEAVSNAFRHGNAREVRVKMRRSTRGHLVAVLDDGCGFQAAAVPAGHYGLRTMTERAEALGGHLRISSVPGRGTTVALHIPRSSGRFAESSAVWRAA